MTWLGHSSIGRQTHRCEHDYSMLTPTSRHWLHIDEQQSKAIKWRFESSHPATNFFIDLIMFKLRWMMDAEFLDDWGARPLALILKLIVKNTEEGGPLPAKDLASRTLEQMIESLFTYHGRNLEVLCDFTKEIASNLDMVEPSFKSERLTRALSIALSDDKDRSEEQCARLEELYASLGRTKEDQKLAHIARDGELAREITALLYARTTTGFAEDFNGVEEDMRGPQDDTEEESDEASENGKVDEGDTESEGEGN